MHLSNVSVVGFRNLSKFDIQLRPGLNVILGENNIGKTNLFDAVRIGLGPLSTSDYVRLDEEDFFRDEEGKRDTHLRISLTFASLSEAEQAGLVEILDFDADSPANSLARIGFEALLDEATGHVQTRRWGGTREDSDVGVPEDVLQAVSVTLLNALRDALSGLLPSRSSRLGRLFQSLAKPEEISEIESIIQSANKSLETNPLVKKVEEEISAVLTGATGPALAQIPMVRTSEPRFERIVNNLRLVLLRNVGAETTKQLFEELRHNGLGYNNLLYIATVLSELAVSKESLLSILLVEEPEAHLHPQLQILLSDFLTDIGRKSKSVQVIVTSHSPTIAAHVSPTVLNVMHHGDKQARTFSVGQIKFDNRELGQLRRMLDATKATLFFARGVILVEGISEVLLLPVLAERLGCSLANAAVSVVPVFGVDFKTIARMFGSDKLAMPLAILTDSDPGRILDESLGIHLPAKDEEGQIRVCERVTNLQSDLAACLTTEVFPSTVTLEYDLAWAGDDNPRIMCEAWENCFVGTPKKLNLVELAKSSDHQSRVSKVWTEICYDSTTRGKGEFAQALAEALSSRGPDGQFSCQQFKVPGYIEKAIRFATRNYGSDT
jgi:putative ATP-dependent endonuclease of OLD family